MRTMIVVAALVAALSAGFVAAQYQPHTANAAFDEQNRLLACTDIACYVVSGNGTVWILRGLKPPEVIGVTP